MPISPDAARLRSQIGYAAQHGNHDREQKKRRDLRAALLYEHVERTLKELPPLTDEQRDRVASLLRGGS
jgi:hypothetical protein